jgi:zinc-binding alcohol dehydrogenase/oxidoreductase
MKAVILKSVGDIEALEYGETVDPSPRAGEVCVRLMAASVNHRDISIRKRASSASMLPLILGSDGAGVVEALGSGVTGWAVGQEVMINPALDWGTSPKNAGPDFRILGGPDPGTYAEKIVVPSENIFLKPDNLSFQEAAACPVGLLTAWRALVTLGAVQPGNRVLIPGIGSGVATFALQIAQTYRAQVYVTSSSNDKLQRARDLGAAGGMNYTEPDWAARLKQMTGGAGFDIVLDSVGSPTFAIGLDLLSPGGRLITFGATAGAQVECIVRHIYSRHLQILGTTLGSPWEFRESLHPLVTGQVNPVIDRVFPLKDAGLAQRRLEAGLQFGKIILEIV